MIDAERALDGQSGLLSNRPDAIITVDIVLGDEMLAAICRRGRRRLRDIQASSKASLKLERLRGVLQVTGSKDTIEQVRRQVESLCGPTLNVTTAVWAELMRTRTNPDWSQAAVARIQQESSCRVHIERNVQQVRLFGTKSEIAVAEQLLGELHQVCIEEAVPVSTNQSIDFESVAQSFGVTLQIDATKITVLGIGGAVKEAVKELRDSEDFPVRDGQQCPGQRKPSENARSAIIAAMSKLTVLGGDGAAPTPDSMEGMQSELQNGGTGDQPMEGVVTTKLPPTEAPQKTPKSHTKDGTAKTTLNSQKACPTCGSTGCFCVHCGKPTREMSSTGCPSCGAVKFCVYCGHPTEKANTTAMMQQAPLSNCTKDLQYMPYYADPVQMSPMPYIQANNYSLPNGNTMPQPQGANGMWIPVNVGYNPGVFGPMLPGSPTNNLHAGMHAGMMPMA